MDPVLAGWHRRLRRSRLGVLVALLVVPLTNGQSRRQAEQALQVAALADFVAAAESVLHEMPASELDGAPDLYLRLRAAHARLAMSGPDAEPLAEVLLSYPGCLATLGRRLRVATSEKSDDLHDLGDQLEDFVITSALYLSKWTHGSEQLRQEALKVLEFQAMRMEAQIMIKDMSSGDETATE